MGFDFRRPAPARSLGLLWVVLMVVSLRHAQRQHLASATLMSVKQYLLSKFRCSSKLRLKDSFWSCVAFPACEARSCKGAKFAHGCCEEACTLDKTYRCRMELRLEVHSNLRFVADVNNLLRSVGRARKNGSNRSDSVLIHLSSKTLILC